MDKTEAIKILKDFHDESAVFSVRTALETLHPELKESEGEKIRKFLIKWIQDNYYHGTTKIPTKTLIAWLEKQDKPIDINPSEFDLRLDKLLKQFETLPKEEITNSLSFYLNVVQNDGTYKYVENSTDKIWPKFKVGDWIVYKDSIWKICNIGLKTYYELLKINNEVSTRHIEDVDKIAHLWTIQDAKDGDVLKEDSCTFIIERMKPNGTAIIHCCLFDDGDFDLGSTLSFDVDSTYPATKEQRDLLFAKMKEAGYRWDAEKKELKKPVSKDLEEAANDYADGENPTCPCEECLIKTFKAGANYVLEQVEGLLKDKNTGLVEMWDELMTLIEQLRK